MRMYWIIILRVITVNEELDFPCHYNLLEILVGLIKKKRLKLGFKEWRHRSAEARN